MADIPMPPAPTKYTDFISLVFIFVVCFLLLRRMLDISGIKAPDTVAGFALVWDACCLGMRGLLPECEGLVVLLEGLFLCQFQHFFGDDLCAVMVRQLIYFLLDGCYFLFVGNQLYCFIDENGA